jgi:hypothetical protein
LGAVEFGREAHGAAADDQAVCVRDVRALNPVVRFFNTKSFRLTLRFQVLQSELAFINPERISVNTFFYKPSIRAGDQK